jgi:hypothetical protein
VVFDLEMLTPQAEFSAMNRPADGVRHLLVGGRPVITDGVMDLAGAARTTGSLARCRRLMMRVPVQILLGAIEAVDQRRLWIDPLHLRRCCVTGCVSDPNRGRDQPL